MLGLDEGGGSPGEVVELLDEKLGVADGGGHEEEAALRQGEEWDLPSPTAGVVGVVVELVDDDVVDGGELAIAQGHVGEDLGGAADDGGVGIDGGVAGDEADVLGAEGLAEGEELFVGEGLDGDGVVAGAAEAESAVVEGGGDEGFAGAGGGVEDDVFAFEEFEDGVFLVVVGLDSGLDEVVEKVLEGLLGSDGRVGLGEGGHGGRMNV